MVNIVVAIIVVLIVSIFSVQNSAPVSISFLAWQFQASLAIVIFLAMLSGIIIGLALTLLVKMKRQQAQRIKKTETKGKAQTPQT